MRKRPMVLAQLTPDGRQISWIGDRRSSNKKIAQGHTTLLNVLEWGPLADIHGDDELILKSPLIELAFERIMEQWCPQSHVALLSLCTSTRPYSKSRKWGQYCDLFADKADLIICSSGGIIPICYEDSYPYLNYDAQHDSNFDDLYIAKSIERALKFFGKFRYKRVVFNYRHNIRNVKVADHVGPALLEAGLIESYDITPTKEDYEQAQAEGFAEAGYKMFPELWPSILEKLQKSIEKEV